MAMRILELSPNSKKKALKIVKHAKKRAHWFNPRTPGWLNKIPGHDPRHVCKLNDYRCVFSYTHDTEQGKVFRHLSISVPSKDYANPAAVKVIASMFGFTGSDGIPNDDFPDDWVVRVKEDGPIDDHCIVVGQDTGLRP